jgi:hypothetical protein
MKTGFFSKLKLIEFGDILIGVMSLMNRLMNTIGLPKWSFILKKNPYNLLSNIMFYMQMLQCTVKPL